MLMDFQVSVNLFPCMDLQSLSNFSCEYLQNAYGLLSSHLGKESALRAYISQTFLWLKRLHSTVKEFHHEVCTNLMTS
jgi:hypothetical protein